MNSVNQVSEYASKALNFVENNKVLGSVLAMLLVLYAALAAPKLPRNVAKLFDNTFVKLGYMFLMAYLVTKDPSVAIISSVALLVTIQTLASLEASNEAVDKVMRRENFTEMQKQNNVTNASLPKIDNQPTNVPNNSACNQETSASEVVGFSTSDMQSFAELNSSVEQFTNNMEQPATTAGAVEAPRAEATRAEVPETVNTNVKEQTGCGGDFNYVGYEGQDYASC